MGNRKKIVIILLAVLAILAIAAVGYYIYSSSQKSDKEKENLQNQIDELKKQADKEKTSTETTPETTKTTPACASTLTDADKVEIQLWKTYENSTYKYSFKYPENWVTTEGKPDSVILDDSSDKTSFQFISNDSAMSTDGLKKTNEKETKIACETATVIYYQTIAAVPGNDRYIHTVFKKNNIFFMATLSYKFIGASLSSDIVEAYDLILKTIECK